jgi:membrane-associated phospholipid phosphatase
MRNARNTTLLLVLWMCSAATAAAQDHEPAPAVMEADSHSAPPDAEWTCKISIPTLLATIGRDLAHLPSKDTLLTLGVGGALAVAVHPADGDLTRRAHQSELLDGTFEVGDALGGTWAQVGGALGALVIGDVVGNRELHGFGVDLARAQAINSLLTHGIKRAAGRTRPDGRPFSFPSGHSSASFATATVVQRHFGWKFGLPAYTVAAYVAASRLQENRHYASDVIFGAALGIVAGRTVTIGRGPARFGVAPMAVPGGAGVTFSRLNAP